MAEESLIKAVALVEDGKYFDAVQVINSSMEEFEKEVGGSDMKILKEPQEFVKEMQATLAEDKKAVLRKWYEVRGDALVGLGAAKRALVDYGCAASLALGDEGLKAKLAKVEASMKDEGRKGNRVPVTVLTGFLGSGKTTLLNRILKEFHGKRLAVIENEFGEVGIDDALVKGGAPNALTTEENIVEMNNGCICCTVRGDLISGLKRLIRNAKKNAKPLDGVLIETTGLADPAPVAQTFFADDFVQQNMVLDGILTVVDAKHVVQHLDEEKPEGVENEAVEQIAFADRVLLNKCDTATEEELVEVESRIRAINAGVQIRRTQFSEVPMDFILNIKAFDLDKVMQMDDAFLDDAHDHKHDDRVSSVGIEIEGEVDNAKLQQWISKLMTEKGVDLFRSKGVLAIRGKKTKYVFQAVHMMWGGTDMGEWEEGEKRICKMVFIGKNLKREELVGAFRACLV